MSVEFSIELIVPPLSLVVYIACGAQHVNGGNFGQHMTNKTHAQNDVSTREIAFRTHRALCETLNKPLMVGYGGVVCLTIYIYIQTGTG